MLGEKAVCAAVSPHLYTLSYIQVLLPNSAAADLSWDHCVWGQSYLSFLHINTCGDIRNCGRIWPSIFLSAFLCSCFFIVAFFFFYIYIYLFFQEEDGIPLFKSVPWSPPKSHDSILQIQDFHNFWCHFQSTDQRCSVILTVLTGQAVISKD